MARQLLAEGGAPRKGFKAGTNPVDEFFVPPIAADFRTTPVPMYEDMNFKIRQNTEDDESDETTNIFDKTKDFLGRNKQAIGGGMLASMLGLGPLGILLGGFLGRRRDQGGGIFESAKARDTRIANEIIAENFRQKQMEKEDKEYQPLIPQFINDLLQRDETKLSSLKKDIIKAVVEKSGLRPSKLGRFLFSINQSCNSVSCKYPLSQAFNDSKA